MNSYLNDVTGFREVSKEDFYNYLNNKDILCSAQGSSPFVIFWKERSGNLIGKTIPHGKQLGILSDGKKYYLLSRISM